MTWFKIKDVANHYGISKTNFSKICKNGNNLAGFKWKYCTDDLPGEVWKEFFIEEFEKLYISNKGRYRRENGKTGYGSKTQAGYRNISYSCLTDNQRTRIFIHKLVMWVFNGYRDYQVNHIDGNKSNNKLENLEYSTASENTNHAILTGLVGDKRNGKMSKQIKQTEFYGNVINIFPSIAEASRQTGISPGNICMVLKGTRPLAGGFKWYYHK
jgi:hypothetical protein